MKNIVRWWFKLQYSWLDLMFMAVYVSLLEHVSFWILFSIIMIWFWISPVLSKRLGV